MLNRNKLFGSFLGVSHFFTDAIASFVLVSISLGFLEEKANFGFGLFFYFMLYNFIAFWWQSFIWYFLDKIEDNKKSFKISKKIILISFIFYLIWLSCLIFSWNYIPTEMKYIFSVIFIWLGSAFFHIWGGNISLLSKNKKATVLWIFASGWVIWLSFWYFLAIYYFNFYLIFFIILFLLWIIIYYWKNFKLEKLELKNNNKNNLSTEWFKLFQKSKIQKPIHLNYFLFIIFLLLFILAFRSAIWTNYQYVFYDEKMIIFYLAISAFFWKITWWILEDNKHFKQKYFIFTWIISLISIIIYTFLYGNLFFILFWIFGLTLFISPITIILNKNFINKKAIIISYSFGLSLILGYLFYIIFH